MGEILDFEKFKKSKEAENGKEDALREEDEKVRKRLEQREKERVSVNVKINSISEADFLRLKSFLKELEGVEYEIKDLESAGNND